MLGLSQILDSGRTEVFGCVSCDYACLAEGHQAGEVKRNGSDLAESEKNDIPSGNGFISSTYYL